MTGSAGFGKLRGAVAIFAIAAQTAAPRPARSAPKGASTAETGLPPATQAVLLEGKPFPPSTPWLSKLPPPRRTFFAAAGKENGDGSEARPWNDLQSALCGLEPGDLLRVRAGEYPGSLRIDAPCRDGKAKAPIQVAFDGKATLVPAGEEPVLRIRRAHWHLLGAYVDLGESAVPGIVVEGEGAHDVTLEGARISGGRGPGVRIGDGTARVTIANSRIAKPRVPAPDLSSVGVEILPGASNVVLAGNQLHENPAGSVRVVAPERGGRPVRDLLLSGNTIHGDDTTAVSIRAAVRLRIEGNTISDQPGRAETRAIELDEVRDGVVRSNRIYRCATGIRVGRADPKGGDLRRAVDVTIDHNLLEGGGSSRADAFAVEAGERIRFVNNVVEGYADAILVFGKPPQTKEVTVANNLVLGASDVAFLLEAPDSARLFDYNIFSARRAAEVQVGGRKVPLARYLEGGAMPNSRAVPGVRILQRDLARIVGIPVIDRGCPLDGIPYSGAAPDIGVAER